MNDKVEHASIRFQLTYESINQSEGKATYLKAYSLLSPISLTFAVADFLLLYPLLHFQKLGIPYLFLPW